MPTRRRQTSTPHALANDHIDRREWCPARPSPPVPTFLSGTGQGEGHLFLKGQNMRWIFARDRNLALTIVVAAALIVALSMAVTATVNAARHAIERAQYDEAAATYTLPSQVNPVLDASLQEYASMLSDHQITLRWDAEVACSGTDGEHPLGCVLALDPATIHLNIRALDSLDPSLHEVVAHETAHALVFLRGIDIDDDRFRLNYQLHVPGEHFAHCAAMAITTQDEDRCPTWRQDIAVELLGWEDYR